MAWGFFNRGIKVTGQSASNTVAQAGGFASTRVGGGTRKEKVFHARFVAFFKSCARKISPRKHTILKTGGDANRYLLARKNDPGNLRLDLAGRLRNPAFAQARSVAAGRADPAGGPTAASSGIGSPAVEASTTTLPQESSEHPSASDARALTGLERVTAIGSRSASIELARTQLQSGDPAERLRGRAAEAKLVSDILADFSLLSDPSAHGISSELAASARELLTLQLLSVKLPEGKQKLTDGHLADSLGSEIETDDARQALNQRYQYLPPKLDQSETDAARKARGDREWPSPVRQADAFLSQLGQLLTQIAAPSDDSGAPPIDARLIGRLFEQARLQAAKGSGNALSKVETYDALYLTRQLLSMVADRGTSSENDAQIRRAVLDEIAPAPEAPTRRLSEKERKDYDTKVKAHQDLLSNLSNELSAELTRRLPLARLKAYCEQVDRQFGKEGSLDDARLQLKLAAAGNDGEREWIKRSHELGLAVRNLDRAWTIRTRHGGSNQSPFVTGSRIRIDAKLMTALLAPTDSGNTLNRVQSTNTRDVNLLVAHAIALQKSLDEQQAWLDTGETSVVDADVSAPDPANQAIKTLFNANDLKKMGFSDTDLNQMEHDGRLAGLLEASSALGAAGMRSADGVAEVNKLVTQARNRLIDNTLATKGLRDLAGVEARAEALVAIANSREATRAPFIAALKSYLSADDAQGQLQEYERAGAALARAYDDRVTIDQEVEQAQQTLKALGDSPMSLKLDASDAKTVEVARQIEEFHRLASVFSAMGAVSRKLEAAIDLEPQGSEVREALEQDLKISKGQLRDIHDALSQSKAALARRANHPLLAANASVIRGESLTAAIQWITDASDAAPKGADKVIDAAAAITTLDTAPARSRLCESRIREAARVQTRILEQRRQALPDPHRAALQLELRSIAASVYLDHLQAASNVGESAPGFVLANYRESFIERAQARGVDTDAFALEIDDMLLRDLDEEALGKWISDTQQSFSDRVLATMSQAGAAIAAARGLPSPTLAGASGAAPVRVAPDTPTVANANRAIILGAIRQMQIGDRVFLKASRKGEIGLSKLPADPSGTLKLDLMLGAGDRNMFDVKRKPNGNFTVSIRAGTTLSARAGVSASPAALAEVAKVSGKIELTSTSVEGCTFEFTADQGIAFIEHILENKPVDAALLATARDIRTVSKDENKLMVEAGLGLSSDSVIKALKGKSEDATKVLKAGLEKEATSLVKAPSVNLAAKAVWSRAWAEATQDNAKVHVLKRATAYQLEASVGAEVTVKLPSLAENVLKPAVSPENGAQAVKSSLSGTNTNLGGLKASVSRVYEAELSVEQKAFDGSLRKAEFEFVVPLVPGLDTAALGSVDPRLKAQLDRLPPDRRAEFDQLLKQVDSSEGYLLLAASRLDDSVCNALNAEFSFEREIANELGRIHSSSSRDAALDRACKAHGERLAGLGEQAAEFKLERLILVKGATMTREQALGVGLLRLERTGQAGTGNTVGQVDLTAPPARVPAQSSAQTPVESDNTISGQGSAATIGDAAPPIADGVQSAETVAALLDKLEAERGLSDRDANDDPAVLIRRELTARQAQSTQGLMDGLVRQLDDDRMFEDELNRSFNTSSREALLAAIRQLPATEAAARIDEVDRRLVLQRLSEDDAAATGVVPQGPALPFDIEAFIRAEGFTTHDIPGDGHCMFASLAHAAGGELRTAVESAPREAAMAIRQRIMQRLVELEPNRIATFARSNNADARRAKLSGAFLELSRGFNVAQPEQSGWGTNYSLPVAAALFNRPIVVIDQNGIGNLYRPDCSEESLNGSRPMPPGGLADLVQSLRNEGGNPPIAIYKSSAAHYQSVNLEP